jgi:bacterioferritin (cytochrome b1)
MPYHPSQSVAKEQKMRKAIRARLEYAERNLRSIYDHAFEWLTRDESDHIQTAMNELEILRNELPEPERN